MPQLIVLKTGRDRIPTALDARARRDVMRDAIRRGQIVGFVIGHGAEIG